MVLDMSWDEDMSLEKYSDLLEVADIYTPNQKRQCALPAQMTRTTRQER